MAVGKVRRGHLGDQDPITSFLRGSVMSRSYKRVPCCKDHNTWAKKYANRYLRRNHLSISSGMAYKKLYCSWDICDYKFLESFRSYKDSFITYHQRRYSDKELYRMWYKDYKMK